MTTRKRVGMLLPSTNTVVEADFWHLVPKNVTIHTERMLASDSSVESDKRMNEDVDRCAAYLATAAPDVAVYACTGGSFLGGASYEKELRQKIEQGSGARTAVSTSGAAVEALRYLGIKKVAIVTPYSDGPGEETELLQVFLEQNGFEVVSRAGKGLGKITSREIGNDSPENVYDFAIQHWNPSADGLFISCTDWRSLEVVDRLEKAIGKPVVTATQATIWATLRVLKETAPLEGYGRLMTCLV